jgi:hypothetical protein
VLQLEVRGSRSRPLKLYLITSLNYGLKYNSWVHKAHLSHEVFKKYWDSMAHSSERPSHHGVESESLIDSLPERMICRSS